MTYMLSEFLAIHRYNWGCSKPVTPTHVGGYVACIARIVIACKVLLIFIIHLTHTLKRVWSLEICSRVIYILVNMDSEGFQNANMLEAAWVAVAKSTGRIKRTWDSEHADLKTWTPPKGPQRTDGAVQTSSVGIEVIGNFLSSCPGLQMWRMRADVADNWLCLYLCGRACVSSLHCLWGRAGIRSRTVSHCPGLDVLFSL